MAKQFFFVGYDLLDAQGTNDGFGPAGDAGGKDRFRTYSYHTASEDPEAYAVCSGEVCGQYVDNDTTLMNIILKPTEALHTDIGRVKYFIYRGIKSNSIINGSGEITGTDTAINKVISTSQTARNTAIEDQTGTNPAEKAGPEALGLHLTKTYMPVTGPFPHTDDDQVDTLFHRDDVDYQFPLISTEGGGDKGAVLGKFDQNGFGLEIVIEGSNFNYPLKYVRKAPNFFYEVDQLSGSPSEADKLDHWHEKEHVLQFIDPCAFYGSFYFVEKTGPSTGDDGFLRAKPTNSLSFSQNHNIEYRDTNLYKWVLSKFANKNKVYVDVRNEHNYSYNYYKNYLDNSTSSNSGYVKLDGTSSDYYAGDWPILILDGTNDITDLGPGKKALFELQLQTGDNNAPAMFLPQGTTKRDFSRNNKNRRFQWFPDIGRSSEDYTNELNLAVPYDSDGAASPTNVIYSSYIKVKYFKTSYASGNDTTPTNPGILSFNYLDNLFSPGMMRVNVEQDNDLHIRVYDDEVFVQLPGAPPKGGAFIGYVGIAEDTDNIYFFTYPKYQIGRRDVSISSFNSVTSQSVARELNFLEWVGENRDNSWLTETTITEGGNDIDLAYFQNIPPPTTQTLNGSTFTFPDSVANRLKVTQELFTDNTHSNIAGGTAFVPPNLEDWFPVIVIDKTNFTGLLNSHTGNEGGVNKVDVARLGIRLLGTATDDNGVEYDSAELVLRGFNEVSSNYQIAEWPSTTSTYMAMARKGEFILKDDDAILDVPQNPYNTVLKDYIESGPCRANSLDQIQLGNLRDFIDKLEDAATQSTPDAPSLALYNAVMGTDPTKRVVVDEDGLGVLSLDLHEETKIPVGFLSEFCSWYAIYVFTEQLLDATANTAEAIMREDGDQDPITLALKMYFSMQGVADPDYLFPGGTANPPSSFHRYYNRQEFIQFIKPNISVGIRNTMTVDGVTPGRKAKLGKYLSIGTIRADSNDAADKVRDVDPDWQPNKRFLFSGTIVDDSTLDDVNKELIPVVAQIIEGMYPRLEEMIQKEADCLYGNIRPYKLFPRILNLAAGEGGVTAGLFGSHNYGLLFFAYDIHQKDDPDTWSIYHTTTGDNAPQLIQYDVAFPKGENTRKSMTFLRPEITVLHLSLLGLNYDISTVVAVEFEGNTCLFKAEMNGTANYSAAVPEVLTPVLPAEINDITTGGSPDSGRVLYLKENLRTATRNFGGIAVATDDGGGKYSFRNNAGMLVATYDKNIHDLEFTNHERFEFDIHLISGYYLKPSLSLSLDKDEYQAAELNETPTTRKSRDEVLLIANTVQRPTTTYKLTFDDNFGGDKWMLDATTISNIFSGSLTDLDALTRHLADPDVEVDANLYGGFVGRLKATHEDNESAVESDPDYSLTDIPRATRAANGDIEDSGAGNNGDLRYGFARIDSDDIRVLFSVEAYTDPVRSRLDQKVPTSPTNYRPALDSHTLYNQDAIGTAGEYNGGNGFGQGAWIYVSGTSGPVIGSYNQVLSALRCLGILEGVFKRIKDEADNIIGVGGFTAADRDEVHQKLDDFFNTASGAARTARVATIQVPIAIAPAVQLFITSAEYTNWKWW